MERLIEKLRIVAITAITIVLYFYTLNLSFELITKANTISNVIGFIGLIVLLAILIFVGYELVKHWVGKSEYEKQKDDEWREHVEKQMKSMQENITKHNAYSDVVKKKSNPKQFDGVESDKPFVKTRKKSKVTIDFTDAKGMNEIDGVIKPIAEGRVKISVEEPKTKRKPKTK
jgi:hypothetical protein